jgi:hypothetical protein
MRIQVFASACVAVVLAACAANSIAPPAPAFPPCDTLGSTATSTSRGAALLYAQHGAAQLYPDARGDLLGVGYRRIRVISRTANCGPYRIGGLDTGLVTCTVRTRICGR